MIRCLGSFPVFFVALHQSHRTVLPLLCGAQRFSRFFARTELRLEATLTAGLSCPSQCQYSRRFSGIELARLCVGHQSVATQGAKFELEWTVVVPRFSAASFTEETNCLSRN